MLEIIEVLFGILSKCIALIGGIFKLLDRIGSKKTKNKKAKEAEDASDDRAA